MEKIQISLEKRDDWDVVRYVGAINEEAGLHLQRIKDAIGKQVVFNFKDVRFVNSSGIRAWVVFLRDFALGRKIAFEECPPIVVTQINMIPSFTSAAEVRSVYAHFVCGSCNDISNVRFVGPGFPKTDAEIRPGVCKKCSNPTHIADSAEEYFEFAHR